MVAALGVGVTQADQDFVREHNKTRYVNFVSMPQACRPAQASQKNPDKPGFQYSGLVGSTRFELVTPAV